MMTRSTRLYLHELTLATTTADSPLIEDFEAWSAARRAAAASLRRHAISD